MAHSFLKRIFYSVTANFISMMVSVVTTFFIPKFLGADVTGYGYYHIYLFYLGYVGFFHLGWCDGLLLREGGKAYQELDERAYTSQFKLLAIMETCFALGIALCIYLSHPSQELLFVACFIGINGILENLKTYIRYILQSTNRIKPYSVVTAVGRVAFLAFVLMAPFFPARNYHIFVLGDTFARVISFSVGCVYCKDKILKKKVKLTEGLGEAVENVRVGIKLLFANLAGMLVSGITRFGVQIGWDVATYGKISFALSVSNFLMVFISAVATVLYPTLRRTGRKKLPELYGVMQDFLMFVVLGALACCYPIQVLLARWLPQYQEAIGYMSLLFPTCIFAAKQTLLINTYLQVYRYENKILKLNMIGLILAVIITAVPVFLVHNLTLLLISMVLIQALLCIISEFVLAKAIRMHINGSIAAELAMAAAFIGCYWFVGGVRGAFMYAVAYIGYLIAIGKAHGNLIKPYLKARSNPF